MAMSKDRVHFTLKDSLSNRHHTINAARMAFGISKSAAAELWNAEARIICRPSQFARFIIYRAAKVTNNAFRQFDVELVTPRHVNTPMDVSKNPAGIVSVEEVEA